MNRYININNRLIGPNLPVYIVAELSANHRQSFDCAVKLTRAAKVSGADAVKVQTFAPDTLTISSEKKSFKIAGGTWKGRTMYDLYEEAYMPWEWQPKLKEVAGELGMDFFSTAFDSSSVTFLEKTKVPVYKIASFEIVDIPLIQRIARTRKPLIISTGMATLAEIGEAVQAARRAGARQIALLKCTSAYPAPLEDMNLRTITNLAQTFKVPVGISDHTQNSVVSAAAVALGACIVEKHLTLSRAIPGPDSSFSLEPKEFGDLVRTIRSVEKALGETKYGVAESEKGSIAFRRSLFVVRNMKAGDAFTEDNLRSIRPAYGLPPRYLKDLLGRRAAQDIERGTPAAWELVA